MFNRKKIGNLEERIDYLEGEFTEALVDLRISIEETFQNHKESLEALVETLQDHKRSIETLAETVVQLSKKNINLIQENQQINVLYLQLVELLREKKIIEGNPTGIQRIH